MQADEHMRLIEAVHGVAQAQRRFVMRHGREPGIDELAKAVDMEPEELRPILELAQAPSRARDDLSNLN